MAIPAKFRTRPKSKSKTFKLMDRPLPFAVLRLLEAGGVGRNEATGTWEFSLSYSGKDEGKHAQRETERVLEAIGNVPSKYGYKFDFNPTTVINSIRISGCIPDAAGYQFYPTPSTVAEAAYEMLGSDGQGDIYLEPSAGIGGLAGLLPAMRRDLGPAMRRPARPRLPGAQGGLHRMGGRGTRRQHQVDQVPHEPALR